MGDNFRGVLERIEKYGELRDISRTRYEKSLLLAPVIKRRLISSETGRGKYELTPAGRQHLAKMRTGRLGPPVTLRWGVLICVTGLAVAWLCVDALGPAMAPVVDELRPSLRSDSDPNSLRTAGPMIAMTPSSTKAEEVIAEPSSPAPTGTVAPLDHNGQQATRSSKGSRTAHGSADRRKRVAEFNVSRSSPFMFGGKDRGQTRWASGWLSHSSPYRDERYDALPVR